MMRRLRVFLANAILLACAQQSFAATKVVPYFNIENPPPSGPAGMWPTTGLMDAHIKAGLNNAMITFGDIGQGDCPDIGVAQQSAIDDIKAFVATGGDLIISISGATCGKSLDHNLVSALTEMIEKTGTHKIDFDVEEDYVKDQSATQRRINTILELKKKYPDLFVSFTLAATPLVDYNTDPNQAGLASGEYALIRETLAAGVKIDRITIMPFAWNFSKETFDQYPFYVLTEMTTESLADQMQVLFSTARHHKIERSQIYSMIGVLPMIGMGDTIPFFQKDAKLVGDYARLKGIGFLSYYVFQRDQAQTSFGQNNDDYLNRYSGVPQKDYEFFHCFQGIDCNP
jgi:hypothetical protein